MAEIPFIDLLHLEICCRDELTADGRARLEAAVGFQTVQPPRISL
jgi:hypothetical protein